MVQVNYRMNYTALREGQQLGPRKAKPFTIPKLAQISTHTFADASAAASETWTLTATDDETGQVWSLPVTSAATVADSLEAIVAAIAANGKFNDLFTATEDGSTVVTLTNKHVGRSFTFAWTFSAGSSASVTVATTQLAGGSKIPFGIMLQRDAEGIAGTCKLLASDATLRDLAGAVIRTDYNHVRPYEPEDARAGYDGMARGKTLSLMHQGMLVVDPETAPSSLSDSVYVRRAQTSSVGTVGAFSAAPAGGQHTMTFTPSAVNLPGYGFEFDYLGVHYTALYLGDGSTTVAQACDGLVQDLGSITGLTITDSTTTVTIAAAAGTQLENVRNLASHTDVPVDSVTIATTGAIDVDTIDISSIARWERLANSDGLAVVRLDML